MNRARTKIVATVGPASREPEVLRQLVREGVDVARLNFSHGDPETHEENVRRIRAAADDVGRAVGIQVDLQGPKLRVAEVVESGISLEKGKEATLVIDDVVGRTPEAIPVQNENLPELVEPGDRVLLDDGMMELEVLSVSEREVRCRVRVGGTLTSNKGINLPGVAAQLPSITEKDRRDLAHALEWEIDWIALSFVRSADGIHELKGLIREILPDSKPVPVMAKIEKPQALDDLPAIIEAADAVMVARGDLGIEIRPEEVPMAQKRIIAACNEAGIPVVTATQMLESMIRNPRPTRAEASDVANAILDGTDAVMLSAETTIGEYPVEAVKTMMRIIEEVEAKRPEVATRAFRPLEGGLQLSIADAVGRAAREAAQDLKATALVTPTVSGHTARVMSYYRPQAPIVAVTPDARVQRRLTLYRGVIPLLAPRADNSDEMIEHAVGAARQQWLVKEGDTLVVTAGAARSEPGTTNLMRIYVVGREESGRRTGS
ncbi:MAG: pyruvate kinase [Chloroflexota bacterium]